MVNPPFQSPQAQPESGVRGNVPAPFGAGERLQSPTYRYLGEGNLSLLPDHLLTMKTARKCAAGVSAYSKIFLYATAAFQDVLCYGITDNF
jgi:hypothetical protein